MPRQVLLISYFFLPYRGVGALRSEYWFRNISRLSSGDYQVSVVTTYTQTVNSEHVFVVKPWRSLGQDQGLSWIFPLFKFLASNHHRFDLIIFSGGPFLHFLLVPWLKLIWKKKLILDYRDPFAINPVFQDSFVKKSIKKKMEFLFNYYADLIFTVNIHCKNLLQTPAGKEISIIDNGFDETAQPKPANFTKDNYTLLLAGGFSQGRSPENLFRVVEKIKNVDVVHIGQNSLNINSTSYRYEGEKNYRESLGYIQAADLCLIFTSGHPYESTTKIFDYLRMNKKILVISDVIPTEGGLFSITQGKQGIYWALNEPSLISEGISLLMNLPDPQYKNIETYSREFGAKQLIKKLDELP